MDAADGIAEMPFAEPRERLQRRDARFTHLVGVGDEERIAFGDRSRSGMFPDGSMSGDQPCDMAGRAFSGRFAIERSQQNCDPGTKRRRIHFFSDLSS
jgi:hypothetical protein